MVAISQIIYSDAFPKWQILYLDKKYHWSLFLFGPINSSGLDNGLAPNRRQAIIWTKADPIHRRLFAALGGDE